MIEKQHWDATIPASRLSADQARRTGDRIPIEPVDPASEVRAKGERCITSRRLEQVRNATLLSAPFTHKIRSYMILLSPRKPGHGLRPPAESGRGDLMPRSDFRLVRTWTHLLCRG